MPAERSPGLERGLGLLALTALVAGNTIGSGIYVTPGTLAQVAGPLSLLAWLLVTLAYFPLALVYADIAPAYPIAGGMQIYVQRAFGDLAGFVTGFLYWCSCTLSNAAFITAFVGYAQVFLPLLGEPRWAFLAAQLLLWSLTGVNIAGVRLGGGLGVVTTTLKVLPLGVLAVALLRQGTLANLHPLAPHGAGALWPAISLVAWLFVGAESVTVPAEEVKGAGPTLRRAALIGYGLTAAVYLLVALALNLGLPAQVLAGSPSPLAAAARRCLGPGGQTLVSLGALVSTAGVLNGWLLVTGRLPYAAAQQGVAPAWLGALHPRTRTPARALVVSALASGALVLLYFSETLLEAYNLVALASTAASLLAIGGTCLALIVLARREPERFSPAARRRAPWIGGAGLAVVALLTAGAGAKAWLLTGLAVALSLPLGLWSRRRR